jgi:uncharacterized membrane protein
MATKKQLARLQTSVWLLMLTGLMLTLITYAAQRDLPADQHILNWVYFPSILMVVGSVFLFFIRAGLKDTDSFH